MSNLKERHLFPGNNTSEGFYSLYSNILTQDDAKRIFCMKGGPGTGKSSLMKKVGAHFLNKGYSIEYLHCSSDVNSLDGVLIKELNVAILDGTSPHVVDPANPGAIDEILNMGDCLDSAALTSNKNEILSLTRSISSNFKHAYCFLRAAKGLHDYWCMLNSESIISSKFNLLTESIKEEIFTTHKAGYGLERHLFSTAITDQGIITYSVDLSSDYKNKYILNGGPGLGKTEILKELGKVAQKKGYFVEYMHDPFKPERLEHIFIPELSTCILTENEISQCTFAGKRFNINDFCNQDIITKNNAEIDFTSKLFYGLINKATSLIGQSHIMHDDLEKYYIDAMNFDKANEIYDTLIERIEKL